MKRPKIKLPRTREDWTFYFQLIGFIGNILFCGALLLGWHPTKPIEPGDKVIVIDSAWAAENLPLIYHRNEEEK